MRDRPVWLSNTVAVGYILIAIGVVAWVFFGHSPWAALCAYLGSSTMIFEVGFDRGYDYRNEVIR
jgi:hypothetical protein